MLHMSQLLSVSSTPNVPDRSDTSNILNVVGVLIMSNRLDMVNVVVYVVNRSEMLAMPNTLSRNRAKYSQHARHVEYV